MFSRDSHGRVVGGLFEACGATNFMLRTSRIDSHLFTPPPPHRLPVSTPALVKSSSESILTTTSNTTTTTPQTKHDLPVSVSSERKSRGGRMSNKQKALSAAAAIPTPASTTTGTGEAVISLASSSSSSMMDTNTTTTEQAELPLSAAAAVSSTSSKRAKPETFCLCKTQYEENNFMIGCDGPCQGWYHPVCLGYIKHKGMPESFSDVDGARLDIQSSQFLCHRCELRQPNLGRQKVLFGLLISKWADVVDCGPEHSVRWQLLMEARRDFVGEFNVCTQCGSRHHPVLPCAGPIESSNSSLLVVKEEQTVIKFSGGSSAAAAVATEDDAGQAMVVGGKYMLHCGRIVHTNKKIALLKNPVDQSLLLVPRHLLYLGVTIPPLVSPTTYLGVRDTPNGGGFAAVLQLSPETEVFLGKFQNKFRAARVHDIAACLQFGEDHAELNFPVYSSNQYGGGGELMQALMQGPNCDHGRDALRILDWCYALKRAAAKEKSLPHRMILDVLALVESTVSDAAYNQMQAMVKKVLESPLVEDSNEDEMDLVMKKLVRARTPRAAVGSGGKKM